MWIVAEVIPHAVPLPLPLHIAPHTGYAPRLSVCVLMRLKIGIFGGCISMSSHVTVAEISHANTADQVSHVHNH